MTLNILEQQLHLHFGESYPEVKKQTAAFCITVIHKPWWGENLPVLLNNEGGMHGMRTHALMRIIEKEDITLGLKDYGNYLYSEYGLTSKPALLSFNEDLEYNFPLIRGETEAVTPSPFGESGFPLAPGGSHSLYGSSDAKKVIVPVQSILPSKNKYSDDVLRYITLSGEELEFFRIYASTQDVRETSALMSLSHSEGLRIHNRVKHRAKRREL